MGQRLHPILRISCGETKGSPELWRVLMRYRSKASRTRSVAVKSQMEVYRGKAKEYARLTILTKSLRESRRYRKLAEMYWALALGEKPESVQRSRMIAKTSPT